MNRKTTEHDSRLEALGLTEEDCEVFDFDPSEGLDCPEAIEGFLDEALATGDAKFVADCIGDVAKAVGMTEIARRAGMSRESLYESLGALRPRLETLRPVLEALGVRLTADSHAVPAAPDHVAEAAASAHG